MAHFTYQVGCGLGQICKDVKVWLLGLLEDHRQGALNSAVYRGCTQSCTADAQSIQLCLQVDGTHLDCSHGCAVLKLLDVALACRGCLRLVTIILSIFGQIGCHHIVNWRGTQLRGHSALDTTVEHGWHHHGVVHGRLSWEGLLLAKAMVLDQALCARQFYLSLLILSVGILHGALEFAHF